MKNICPALMRFFGFLGFIALGLGSLYLGNWIFHLGINLHHGFSLSAFGKKGIILIVVSFILGLIGMAIGWSIGVSIRIRNQRIADVINVLWHYGANGIIIWIAASSTAVTLALGKEEAKEFVLAFGTYRAILILIGISVITGWLIGITAFLTTRAIRHRDELSYAISWIVSIIIGAIMGAVQMRIFGISIFYGIGMGIIFPLFLIPISNYTQMRDEQTRREI